MKTQKQICAPFGNDVTLWRNMRKHYCAMPNGGARMLIYDGMIHNGHEVLARCKDDLACRHLLFSAGFLKLDDESWKADGRSF